MTSALSSPHPSPRPGFVYVSNAEDGDIAIYRLTSDGSLEAGPRVPAAPRVMPLAASRDGRFLYAASRAEPYGLLCYAIDGATGGLRHLGTAALPDSMVHLAIDRSGRWLFATSYGGHVVSVHALAADGRAAGQPVQCLATGGLHPHSLQVDLGNRFVHVPHLGTDEIRAYRFDADTGRLSPQPASIARLPTGTGPRHAAMAPDHRFAYVLGELDGTVSVFRREPSSGDWQLLQAVPSLPAGTGLVPGAARGPAGAGGSPAAADPSRAIWCADLQITPDGRFLYASERTGSTLSCLEVDRTTGLLTWRSLVPTEAQPRSLAIEPGGRFLVASGERSDMLSLYAIDPATGALTLRHRAPAGRGANWVQIVQPH